MYSSSTKLRVHIIKIIILCSGKTTSEKHEQLILSYIRLIRRHGVVGRVSAFQLGGPGSIPYGVGNFNSYPGTGCVLCVLSCDVSGGGPDIVLTTNSGIFFGVLVHSLLLPYRHLSHTFIAQESNGTDLPSS